MHKSAKARRGSKGSYPDCCISFGRWGQTPGAAREPGRREPAMPSAPTLSGWQVGAPSFLRAGAAYRPLGESWNTGTVTSMPTSNLTATFCTLAYIADLKKPCKFLLCSNNTLAEKFN